MSKKADAVQTVDAKPLAPVDDSPAGVLQMIQRAMDKNQDPETLGKFMDLYERMQATAARQAFNTAMLEFQNRCPVVVKSSLATAGSFSYRYASLEQVAAAIRPHLEAQGLSYSWANAEDAPANHVRITTTIRHVGGHSETFRGPAYPTATKAGMSQQQAVGSAESYAKRYGLLSALGITVGGEDNDAAKLSEFITDDQIATLEALIEEVKADRVRFLKWAGVDQVGHIPQEGSKGYRKCVELLEAKR